MGWLRVPPVQCNLHRPRAPGNRGPAGERRRPSGSTDGGISPVQEGSKRQYAWPGCRTAARSARAPSRAVTAAAATSQASRTSSTADENPHAVNCTRISRRCSAGIASVAQTRCRRHCVRAVKSAATSDGGGGSGGGRAASRSRCVGVSRSPSRACRKARHWQSTAGLGHHR